MSFPGKYQGLLTCFAAIAGFSAAVVLVRPDSGVLPDRDKIVEARVYGIPMKPCLLQFNALDRSLQGEPPPRPTWLFLTRRAAGETFCTFNWDWKALDAFQSALGEAGVTIDKVLTGDDLSDTRAFYASLGSEARAFIEIADLAAAFLPSSPLAARYAQVRDAARSIPGTAEIVASTGSLPRRYEVHRYEPTVTFVTDVGAPIKLADLLEAFGNGRPPVQLVRRWLLRAQVKWFVEEAAGARREMARLVAATNAPDDLPDVTIYFIDDVFAVKLMRDSSRSAFYDPRARSVFVRAGTTATPAVTEELGLQADAWRLPGALMHETMHYLHYRSDAAASRFALEGEALASGEMELRGIIAGQGTTRAQFEALSDLGNSNPVLQQQVIHSAVLASPFSNRQCVLLTTVADRVSDVTGASLMRLMSYTSQDWDALPDSDSAFAHALAWAVYESRLNGPDGSLAALSGAAQRIAAASGGTAADKAQLEEEALFLHKWLSFRSKELTTCRGDQAVREVARRLADGRKSSP